MSSEGFRFCGLDLCSPCVVSSRRVVVAPLCVQRSVPKRLEKDDGIQSTDDLSHVPYRCSLCDFWRKSRTKWSFWGGLAREASP